MPFYYYIITYIKLKQIQLIFFILKSILLSMFKNEILIYKHIVSQRMLNISNIITKQSSDRFYVTMYTLFTPVAYK